MTFSKKRSRLITVDDAVYRWRVGPRRSSAPSLRFAVERAEEQGGVLMVTLPCARPDNGRGERTIAVTPRLVGACVRRAVEQGWGPGRSFTLDVTEDDLTAFLGEPPRYLVPFLWGMIPEGGGIEDLPPAVQIWPVR